MTESEQKELKALRERDEALAKVKELTEALAAAERERDGARTIAGQANAYRDAAESRVRELEAEVACIRAENDLGTDRLAAANVRIEAAISFLRNSTELDADTLARMTLAHLSAQPAARTANIVALFAFDDDTLRAAFDELTPEQQSRLRQFASAQPAAPQRECACGDNFESVSGPHDCVAGSGQPAAPADLSSHHLTRQDTFSEMRRERLERAVLEAARDVSDDALHVPITYAEKLYPLCDAIQRWKAELARREAKR